MEPEELRQRIDTGMTEQMLQTYRQEIYQITGKYPPYRRRELQDWWDDNKSYVSRKVNEALDEEEESEGVEEDYEDEVVEADEADEDEDQDEVLNTMDNVVDVEMDADESDSEQEVE